MGEFRRIELDNGARLLLDKRADSSSVAINFSVSKGSRHEPASHGGMTHFIEHMLFKGTPNRDLNQIAREINLQGGGMNASTSNDMVRLYTRVIAEDMPDAIDLLADMLLASSFPAKELERERGVILEEIAEYNDSPEDLCFDNFLQKLWMPHPLGRPILGTPESVSRFTHEDLNTYWQELLHPSNIIVSMAGALELDETEALLRRYFDRPALPSNPQPVEAPAVGQPGRVVVNRDLEQVQFCLGCEAIKRTDPRRFAFVLLDLILGGGMGSRLFNEVREKRGLAYTIASNGHLTPTEGYQMIYGATTESNIDEVLDLCREQIALIATEAPTEEELETAKRQAIRSFLLSLESNMFHSARNCERELCDEYWLTDEEIVSRVRAVTGEELRALAEGMYAEREFTLSLVGPLEEDASDETKHEVS